jgi:tetratricopeptide (TPR) repeat protein
MSEGSRQKSAVVKKAGPPATALPGADAREQRQTFDRAIALFQVREYAGARDLFEAAAGGPLREVAHSARLHVQMCARRIETSEPAFGTPEEHYNYAITLINARKLPQAEKHLREALAQVPAADHIHYALALCRGLSGDIHAAHAHLRRAIELHGRNRIAARNDPDFATIARLSPVYELLYPEK